jgi:hypothetical protein
VQGSWQLACQACSASWLASCLCPCSPASAASTSLAACLLLLLLPLLLLLLAAVLLPVVPVVGMLGREKLGLWQQEMQQQEGQWS